MKEKRYHTSERRETRWLKTPENPDGIGAYQTRWVTETGYMELTIDLDAMIRELCGRALKNKTGKAKQWRASARVIRRVRREEGEWQ